MRALRARHLLSPAGARRSRSAIRSPPSAGGSSLLRRPPRPALSSRTSQATECARPSSSASAWPFSAFTSAIVSTGAARVKRSRAGLAEPRGAAHHHRCAGIPLHRGDRLQRSCSGLLRGVDLLGLTCRVGDARQGEGEEVLRVGQPAHQLQGPLPPGPRSQPLGRELRADLGAQFLTRLEVHGQVECACTFTASSRRARRRISIHSWSLSNSATCSKSAGSKSASSSRLSTTSTLRLNSAVTPSLVVVGGLRARADP